MIFWFVFLIVTALALMTPLISDKFWAEFWWWKLVAFSILLGTICTVWISVGGIRDAFRLFKDLRAERVDESDDGFVKDGAAMAESTPDDPADKGKAAEADPA
jgi:hypothetical protein